MNSNCIIGALIFLSPFMAMCIAAFVIAYNDDGWKGICFVLLFIFGLAGVMFVMSCGAIIMNHCAQ